MCFRTLHSLKENTNDRPRLKRQKEKKTLKCHKNKYLQTDINFT